jgi:hypothetical protein
MSSLKHFMVVEENKNVIKPIVGISGATYIATSGISVGRYAPFEKFRLAASLGVLPKQLFDSMKKTHELFNGSKFADAILNNANNMVSVARIADGDFDPFIYMCTMFLNKEDEDLSTWDEAKAHTKIEDWKEYAMDDFFLFAKNLTPVCTDNLNEIFRSTMANKAKETEENPKTE